MMIAIYSLATFGALMVLWCVFGAFVLPAGGKGTRVLVRISAKPGRTERQLRSLQWLLDTGLLRSEICLLDEGMTPAQKAQAERWMRRYPGVTLCAPEEIGETMKEA